METLPLTIKAVLCLVACLGFGLAFSSSPAMANIAANPTSLAFGTVRVGTKKSLFATVKNTGRAGLKITKTVISGAPAFSMSGLNTPTTLAAGESLTFKIGFAPEGRGLKSGKLTLTAVNSTLGVALSGDAIPAGKLNISPTRIRFGNVNVGTTKKATSTVTASGGSVLISSAGTSSGEFTVSGTALPVTLAAGKSLKFTVTFTPQSSGAASGSAKFLNNASDSSLLQNLYGTGVTTIQPPPHSVNLTWKSSTSSVAGYNIYRGTVSGGPYAKLNSSLDAATTYTDDTVASGMTYYYVATAVNSDGSESAYSGQVKAVVPTN